VGSNPTPRTNRSGSRPMKETVNTSFSHLELEVSSLSKAERPMAYAVNYNGLGQYAQLFQGTRYGVMFEDDGATGYLYATNDKFDQIFDSLHLYNAGGRTYPKKGDQIFIVWNPELQKAGIYYDNQFQAVIDFRNKQSCCRTGFPTKGPGLWSATHLWDETMTKGLEQ